MLIFYRSPRIKRLWDEELKTNSYYGIDQYLKTMGPAHCRLGSATIQAPVLVLWIWGTAMLGSWTNLAGAEGSQIAEIKAKAENGDVDSQFKLAKAYSEGRGVATNFTEAGKWCLKAAQAGHAGAQVELGFMTLAGEGFQKDSRVGLSWLRRAAESGDVNAQGILAGVLWDGVWRRGSVICVEKDTAESMKWFRKAAEQGDPSSQVCLASYYGQGYGVPRDHVEEIKWLRKAADQGNVTAMNSIGQCYEFHLQNYQEAVTWYLKAAEHRDWQSANSLGEMCETGRGLPQDFTEAYKWYNVAAAFDFPPAAEKRDKLARHMTPPQIAEGQRRASDFAGKTKNRSDPGDRRESGGDNPKNCGSGFFVSEDGHLVTNFHVVNEAARISVKTKRGLFPARLIKADPVNDIAVVKVTGIFAHLPVASSRAVGLGDSVFTVGFPNPALQGLAPKLTDGKISSLAGAKDDPRYFQISAPVQPGNSGGALVNSVGNVIGIVTARLSDKAALETSGALPQNVNYAIKSSYVLSLLESLPEIPNVLKEPRTAKQRSFEEVVKEAQEAAALVLVY